MGFVGLMTTIHWTLIRSYFSTDWRQRKQFLDLMNIVKRFAYKKIPTPKFTFFRSNVAHLKQFKNLPMFNGLLFSFLKIF